MSAELVLLVIATAGAGAAALFAILCFLRTQQLPAALTAQGATQILRAETDIVRAAVEDQARGLRQELGQSLKGFQELTLAALDLRDGIDAQVRGFGERLDGGAKAIDERAAAISVKLNDEMARMRSEAQPGDPADPDRAEARPQHRPASRRFQGSAGRAQRQISPARHPGFRFPHRGRSHPKGTAGQRHRRADRPDREDGKSPGQLADRG